MRNLEDRERVDVELRHWRTMPLGRPRAPLLLAVRDPALRVELAAALVLVGHRVVLARTPAETAALARGAEVVVADARLVAGAGLATRQLLRKVVYIAVCEREAPTPRSARARFTPPFAPEDLVLAVLMLSGRCTR